MAFGQGKIKRWFDKDAQSRNFIPGDKVLVLLPIPGSLLQARYIGPYVVRDECDYVVATPDRRWRNRLCHINMFKPYVDRVCSPSPVVLKSVVALSGAEVINQVEAAVALSSADLPESANSDCDVVNLSSAVVEL